MNLLVEYFVTFPLYIRASVALLVVFLLWWLCGKKVFWVLSFLPLGLRCLFRCIYRFVEWPIDYLHRKFGTWFGGLDKGWAIAGERIDSIIETWYEAWHQLGTYRFGRIVLGYLLLITYILFPSFLDTDIELLTAGETLYLKTENAFLDWVDNGWFDVKRNSETDLRKTDQHNAENDMYENKISEEKPQEKFEIRLVVCGLKTSLLLRDIPSVEDSVSLKNLYNDDIVIWSGELVFSEVKDGKIEPWVKVHTLEGIEGWSRLAYLRPEEHENVKYLIQRQEEME